MLVDLYVSWSAAKANNNNSVFSVSTEESSMQSNAFPTFVHTQGTQGYLKPGVDFNISSIEVWSRGWIDGIKVTYTKDIRTAEIPVDTSILDYGQRDTDTMISMEYGYREDSAIRRVISGLDTDPIVSMTYVSNAR